MPILGAHMSMAGGYYKAVEIAQRCGCDCVQLFTNNPPSRSCKTPIQYALSASGNCNALGG